MCKDRKYIVSYYNTCLVNRIEAHFGLNLFFTDVSMFIWIWFELEKNVWCNIEWDLFNGECFSIELTISIRFGCKCSSRETFPFIMQNISKKRLMFVNSSKWNPLSSFIITVMTNSFQNSQYSLKDLRNVHHRVSLFVTINIKSILIWRHSCNYFLLLLLR